MKKIFFLVLGTILMQLSIAQKQGQQLIDSALTVLSKNKSSDSGKVKLLNVLGEAYYNTNEYLEAIKYLEDALHVATNIDYKKGMATSNHFIGTANISLGNYDTAITVLNKAVKLWEIINDKKGNGSSCNQLARVYLRKGNYPEALHMMFKALKFYEEVDFKPGIAALYNNIGIVYRDQGNSTESLKKLNQALTMYEQTGNRKAMHHPYNNMGGIYYDQGKFTEAIEKFSEALKIREEIGDKYEIAVSLTNLGLCYMALDNYSKAGEYFNSSLKICNEIDYQEQAATNLADIGIIKTKNKQYNEARSDLSKALTIQQEIGYTEGLRDTYAAFADLDSATGDFKKSLENYKKYISYRDSAVNDENKKQLVEQQMQYDFDKKESLAKAEQDKKDAIALKELQKQKLVRNGFVGGFTVVLLFASVFFTQRNKISKGKKRSDELLLNILPSEVAEELKAKGSADAKQFDDVTVMFTDFKNFTRISEKLSPADLVAEIHTCFKAFDSIITKHNIEKIKTIGDSYMCAGGLPVANKTNAVDVVSAAMEIQQFMNEHLQQRKNEGKEPFEIRIGVHTGPVVAGIVGVKKFAYDIWGDTVNIASRMESSGEAGKVNISGSTYELAKNKFKCEHRGKIQAKNKGETDMYFVESII